MYGLTRIKWAIKILFAKYFVVLTDKESVIAMKGIRPDKFQDLLALKAQQNAIEDFGHKLKKLRSKHDKMVDKLVGNEIADKPKSKGAYAKSRKTSKKPASVKNIKVKEG